MYILCLDRHAWWFTNDEERTYDSKEQMSKCFGFDESVQHIDNILQEKGPFDGILGFSQGACFLSLLSCLQQQGSKYYMTETKALFLFLFNLISLTCFILGLKGSFKFAIFVSGYLSRCVAHQSLYNGQLALPTLHVFGESDMVIPEGKEKSSKAFTVPS